MRLDLPSMQHRLPAARPRLFAPETWRPARPLLIASLLALLALSPAASAHVVLAQKVALAGTYHRAQFMVGHGCAGSATVSVQVDIPDGVPVARPQPKPGWNLTYETGPLAEPAMVHGKQKTEGIRRVTWAGGPLPDEQYDEFGMMLFVAKPGRLHFRVLQICQTGANDWSGVASDGGPKPAFPAATLDVLAPHGQGGGHHHGHVHPESPARPEGPASMPPPADADASHHHAH